MSTKFFLNAAKQGATLNYGFNSLGALLKEIETQCMPFYCRLARFIAMTTDKETAAEKGFVFNAEGELVFSEEVIKSIDRYLKKDLGASVKTVYNWKTSEDYAMFRRNNRNQFFKLAFLLKLNRTQTNEMFNKLFAHPAFIREPETLIMMRCLDKKKSWEDAQKMVKAFDEKSKVIPANEVFEIISTVSIFDYECKDDDEYTTYLAANRKQFEVANVTAAKIIKELAEKHLKRESYIDKLENIEYVFSKAASNPVEGWEGFESFDEMTDENSDNKAEEIRAVMTCFPLFVSLLSKEAPEIDGKLVEIFYNNAECSTGVDGKFDAKIFSESFNEDIGLIDISNIDSVFLRKAFIGFPNINMIYDEKKLNDSQVSKFIKYEHIRKLLIMMAFLEYNTEKFCGKFEDSCNDYLARCGFGELYTPNPFDFMFMLASNAENPIDVFRTLWDLAFSLGASEQ